MGSAVYMTASITHDWAGAVMKKQCLSIWLKKKLKNGFDKEFYDLAKKC